MSKDLISYPKDSGVDLVHTATKAAISSVPVLGGAIAEFFGTFVPSSLETRRDEWAEMMTKIVRELLDRKVVTLEDLRTNPAFTDILIEATIQATRTSSEAKRLALANAINSVARRTVDLERQHIFVRLIEEFTESHILLLRAYYVGKFGKVVGTGADVESRFIALVGAEFPELASDRSFILHLCSDLAGRSLIAVPQGGAKSLGGINYNSMRVTRSGTDFLRFVGAVQ